MSEKEKASYTECTKLRNTINRLTYCQLLTKGEYARFLFVIKDVLKRLENEND